MFDFHTHTLLSDGVLLPSELARRYEERCYQAIAITDHVDASNIKMIVPAIVEFSKKWPKNRIKILPGIELTHIPLEHFQFLIKYARKNGIKVIVAHGETTVEPVIKGTNRKALESDIDILAHPGLISQEDVKFAKERGKFLEITARKGHNLTNSHVAKLALQFGAKLIINSDSHTPEDIPNSSDQQKLALECGINHSQLEIVFKEVEKYFLLNKNNS